MLIIISFECGCIEFKRFLLLDRIFLGQEQSFKRRAETFGGGALAKILGHEVRQRQLGSICLLLQGLVEIGDFLQVALIEGKASLLGFSCQHVVFTHHLGGRIDEHIFVGGKSFHAAGHGQGHFCSGRIGHIDAVIAGRHVEVIVELGDLD